MSWVLSVLLGFITSIGGCLAAVGIASLCVSWYRISSFEGGSGYFVVFMGLIGIVVGFIAGIACARIVAAGAEPGFLKGLGVALGSLTTLALIILALCRLGADLPPTLDGHELEVAIEVRTPVGFTLPVVADEYGSFAGINLPRGKTQPNGKLRMEEARQENGRWIIPATFPLQTSVASKFIRAYFNKDNDATISARFSGHPKRKDCEWSEWFESAWVTSKPRPAPENAFFVRHRIQLVQEVIVPRGPSQAELDAKKAADEQAEFAALAPGAPIREWFRYTAYGTAPDRLAIAIKNITSRENFVAELSALIRSDNVEEAKSALYLFEKLPVVPAELVPPVAEYGRKIATAIEAFNASTPEQDPHYQAAADISLQFSPWIDAARAIRKQGCGDLAPELGRILELSRLRADSECMRRDVLRVASYYMHEWTGLVPLPTDPKPR